MEIWLLILASLSFTLLLHFLFRSNSSPPLPPNPNFFPFLGTIQWLREGVSGLDLYLRSAHLRLGPILTLRITSRPSIFVADRFLAHQALVQNGVVFADRPPLGTINKIVDKHNISSGSYGATWRLLRRNITSEILNPLRVRSYSHARHWVLEILFERFRNNGDHAEPIVVVDHLHYAMFALLVLMCFGDKLDEKQIKEVEVIQRKQLLSLTKFNVFNIWPKLTKLILRRRWQEFVQIRKEQRDVLVPLIRARLKIVEERKKRSSEENKDYVQAYVDTLLDLELPEEERKLNEEDIMNLCSEFLTAGTDTTATALQWIMANLVKYPKIQERLHKEIITVVGEEAKEVKEEDLQKMPYLKAVVLEALRKHPPGHFVLPHSVTEDTVLGGYKVPKDGTVNFMVVAIGRDPKVWEEPMEFKPERFIGEEEEAVDITGSRGIKMMPFGAGRRICPAIGLAMLHLEYYVANMVKEFEWKEVKDDEVDFSEKIEFTVVMKHTLKARAVPRTSH